MTIYNRCDFLLLNQMVIIVEFHKYRVIEDTAAIFNTIEAAIDEDEESVVVDSQSSDTMVKERIW